MEETCSSRTLRRSKLLLVEVRMLLLTVNDQITMPSADNAMMAKTAHSQSVPPEVICLEALGGLWLSEESVIARFARVVKNMRGRKEMKERTIVSSRMTSCARLYTKEKKELPRPQVGPAKEHERSMSSYLPF